MDLERNKLHFGASMPTCNSSVSKIVVVPKNDERPSLFNFKINPVHDDGKPKFANKKFSAVEVDTKQISNLFDFNGEIAHGSNESKNATSLMGDFGNNNTTSVTNNKTVNLLDLGFDNNSGTVNNAPQHTSENVNLGFMDFNNITVNNNIGNTGKVSGNYNMNSTNPSQNINNSDLLLSALNSLPQQTIQSNQIDYYINNPGQISYPTFNKVNYSSSIPTNTKITQAKDPFSDLFG
jgi:hypothetical protein